jgi:hypothetical protein
LLVLTVLKATLRIIIKICSGFQNRRISPCWRIGIPEQTDIALLKDQIHDIPQVSNEENEILIADFTENEVREAVFQMEHNKAPRPDGFPAEFYQVFWGDQR